MPRPGPKKPVSSLPLERRQAPNPACKKPELVATANKHPEVGHGSLPRCPHLEKRLVESKSILNIEKINREREKRKLVEDSENLSNKTLRLEQRVNFRRK